MWNKIIWDSLFWNTTRNFICKHTLWWKWKRGCNLQKSKALILVFFTFITFLRYIYFTISCSIPFYHYVPKYIELRWIFLTHMTLFYNITFLIKQIIILKLNGYNKKSPNGSYAVSNTKLHSDAKHYAMFPFITWNTMSKVFPLKTKYDGILLSRFCWTLIFM